MIALTKALHIAALVTWCAGLLALPGLYAQHGRLHEREAIHELHRLARVIFVNVMSPAAFVTVITGTILIFLRNVFTVWMMLKLAAVGAMVLLHAWQGYVMLPLFDSDSRYGRWRQISATVATFCVISAILMLVLAKPAFDLGGLPDWLRRPGGLQSLLETIRPIP